MQWASLEQAKRIQRLEETNANFPVALSLYIVEMLLAQVPLLLERVWAHVERNVCSHEHSWGEPCHVDHESQYSPVQTPKRIKWVKSRLVMEVERHEYVPLAVLPTQFDSAHATDTLRWITVSTAWLNLLWNSIVTKIQPHQPQTTTTSGHDTTSQTQCCHT